jgi:hypothetical protein
LVAALLKHSLTTRFFIKHAPLASPSLSLLQGAH